MEIGIFTLLYQGCPLEGVARYVSELEHKWIELLAARGNRHLDLDEVLKGRICHIAKYNLKIIKGKFFPLEILFSLP